MSVDATVLVIDVNSERRQTLKSVLEFLEYTPVPVADCKQWRAGPVVAEDIRAVLLGDCGSDKVRAQILRSIKEWAAQVPVLLLVDKQRDAAVPAEIAAGVLAQVELPVRYPQLSHVMQQAQIYRESREPASSKRPLEVFRSLVGNSRAIAAVRKLIERVANSDANVLILGESGTGKEVVARNLHYHSTRRAQPFVPVNCGAIPPDLLESELFGHEKGAFTGAVTARQGRFELAEGGTLFLDEIGDMSLAMQVKLLRVLQERTFERVGSSKSMVANVRIIAATHINLEQAMKQSKFREDLFYRLNVFPIEMPPLRERIEDIPPLIVELVRRIEHEKRGSVRLTPVAVLALCQYPWPGNVRELANLIERLAILHPHGTADIGDLPEKFHPPGATPSPQALLDAMTAPSLERELLTEPRLPRDGLDLKEHLQSLELSLIQQALDESGGVVAHAAERLKMRRTTLVEKLRKYGLQRSDQTSEV